MSESGRLHVNERLVTAFCTSFCVASWFLIFTTTQHFIKFLNLKKDLQGIYSSKLNITLFRNSLLYRHRSFSRHSCG